MVDGHVDSATVVDLDGTLFRVNSLRTYLRTAMRHHLRRGAVLKCAGMGVLFIARRFRLISHETMKYRALFLAGRADAMLSEFRDAMLPQINETVKSFLAERKASGDRILLASAAAGFYIPLLWNGEYLASPEGGPDLRGNAKRDAVVRWANENHVKVKYFLTDHYHDLPLALWTHSTGGEVIMINPSPKSLDTFNRAIPTRSI